MKFRIKKLTYIFMSIIIGCAVTGCGDGREYKVSGEEKSVEADTKVEETETEEREEKVAEKETVEAEILETEEKETPEEKTIRLRGELPMEPTVSKEEITDLRIEIHKQQHALQLWDGEELIAEYAVGLSKDQTGAKEKEGDNKNPEGTYYVCNKNSKSQYHLALGLSYPNIEDANRGYETGLISEKERDSLIRANENGKKPNWYTALGGEIMIHGQKGEQGSESDWTRGCFAANNEVMDMIWDYVEVGTEVRILAD